MSAEEGSPIKWEWFSFARVRLLRELSYGRSGREAAQALHLSYYTVRSQVRDLKMVTGCGDVREIGRWWRVNGQDWVAWCEQQAGVMTEKPDDT